LQPNKMPSQTMATATKLHFRDRICLEPFALSFESLRLRPESLPKFRNPGMQFSGRRKESTDYADYTDFDPSMRELEARHAFFKST
jgi:hypothetical protein